MSLPHTGVRTPDTERAIAGNPTPDSPYDIAHRSSLIVYHSSFIAHRLSLIVSRCVRCFNTMNPDWRFNAMNYP